MRVYTKSWQDRRPEWRRRVRWFEGQDPLSIRLKFTDLDEGRERNGFYRDREEATRAYEAFIAGASVQDVVPLYADDDAASQY
jgi:hypothetical protein